MVNVRRVGGRLLALVAVCALVVGCGGTPTPGPYVTTVPPLRVGVSPGSAPLVFLREGRVVGLEADFAQRFADELRRPLQFVLLEWRQLIPALLDGKIDVVMSGMSATQARSVRVTFSDPYLRSGLLALIRRGDAQKLSSAEAIVQNLPQIGVKEGTTAEAFVRDRFQWNEISLYPTTNAAVTELLQRRIDVFVSDAPIVVWQASAHDGELMPIRKLLNRDDLAWAFRPDHGALVANADAMLARMQADGTLAQMVRRWMPYWPGL
jgi:ABC-type amino acid transport substrate-binding protein